MHYPPFLLLFLRSNEYAFLITFRRVVILYNRICSFLIREHTNIGQYSQQVGFEKCSGKAYLLMNSVEMLWHLCQCYVTES